MDKLEEKEKNSCAFEGETKKRGNIGEQKQTSSDSMHDICKEATSAQRVPTLHFSRRKESSDLMLYKREIHTDEYKKSHVYEKKKPRSLVGDKRREESSNKENWSRETKMTHSIAGLEIECKSCWRSSNTGTRKEHPPVCLQKSCRPCNSSSMTWSERN